MITLSETSHTLDYTMTAVTTNPVEFVYAYVEITTTSYVPAGSNGSSSGPGPNTLIGAPATSGIQRQVKYLSVFNADTVDNVFTWQMNIAGTRRTIRKVTLQPNETLVWDGVTWKTYTFAGEEKVITVPVTGVTHSGTATLAFGSTPITELTVVVTGQTWVAADSEIHAYFMAASTADNSATDHLQAGSFMSLTVGDLVVGVGFTIYAYVLHGYVTGDFTVCWEGS